MKKTWKELLYDISCSSFVEKYIPILPMILGLLCLVEMIASAFLFECQLLRNILFYMFFCLPIIGIEASTFFDAVKTYKKETFLFNKIRNTLLANESFLITILSWAVLAVLFLVVDIFNTDTYAFRLTVAIGIISVLPFSIVISKPISKYFKKKLVYVENENNNLKDN